MNGGAELHLVSKPPVTEEPERGLTYREVQKRAWATKQEKGFNTTNVHKEFGLLVEEVGEAHKAYRMEKPDYGEELADIAIYTAGLAEMTGVDLEAEVEHKLAKVRGRHYERLPNGEHVKRGQEPGELRGTHRRAGAPGSRIPGYVARGTGSRKRTGPGACQGSRS